MTGHLPPTAAAVALALTAVLLVATWWTRRRLQATDRRGRTTAETTARARHPSAWPAAAAMWGQPVARDGDARPEPDTDEAPLPHLIWPPRS